MIAAAEEVAGLKFSDEERADMADGLSRARNAIGTLHKEPLDMSMFPTIVFDPLPVGQGAAEEDEGTPTVRAKVPVMARPGSLDELAYEPVTHLSELVRTRKVKPSRAHGHVSVAAQALRPAAPLRRSISPKSARASRRRTSTQRSRAATIAVRCTASRGARRTCSP